MTRCSLLIALVLSGAVIANAVPAHAATTTHSIWMTVRPLTAEELGSGPVTCEATTQPGYEAVSGEPDGEFGQLSSTMSSTATPTTPRSGSTTNSPNAPTTPASPA